MARKPRNPLFDLLVKPDLPFVSTRRVVSPETIAETEARRARWRKHQADARARKRENKPPRVLKHDAQTRARWAEAQRACTERKRKELMTPEGKVKSHLKKRIKALGGEVRFVKWIGRRSCPDCRVMLWTASCWVETKAGKDGQLSIGQEREIKSMRSTGERVLVLTTIEEIDREFPPQ